VFIHRGTSLAAKVRGYAADQLGVSPRRHNDNRPRSWTGLVATATVPVMPAAAASGKVRRQDQTAGDDSEEHGKPSMDGSPSWPPFSPPQVPCLPARDPAPVCVTYLVKGV